MTNNTSINNFQGRYVILHPWEGAMLCERPQRGRWGGPPADAGVSASPQAARNTTLAGSPPKAGKLEDLVAENVSALGVTASRPLNPLNPEG